MSKGADAIEEYKKAKAAMVELEQNFPGIGQLVDDLVEPVGEAVMTDGTPVHLSLLYAANTFVAASRRRARALEVLNPPNMVPPCDTEPEPVA